MHQTNPEIKYAITNKSERIFGKYHTRISTNRPMNNFIESYHFRPRATKVHFLQEAPSNWPGNDTSHNGSALHVTNKAALPYWSRDQYRHTLLTRLHRFAGTGRDCFPPCQRLGRQRFVFVQFFFYYYRPTYIVRMRNAFLIKRR